MRLFYSILLYLLLSNITSFAQTQNYMNKQQFSFLALGDSYTIGEAVEENERWPIQLKAVLEKRGVALEPVKIIATTGWTTDELQKGIEKAKIDGQTYDLVSLLIGVNNQYRGYPIAQYQKEFKELLVQAIQFAGGDVSSVFVISIPDYGVTPFAKEKDPEKIARELDEYNAIANKIASDLGVAFFDITSGSKKAKEDLELIAKDGLHPSGKMYADWVNLTSEWVYQALK